MAEAKPKRTGGPRMGSPEREALRRAVRAIRNETNIERRY
jgi:hypothetical protein